MLVLLYYLSQNADFSKSVEPLMRKLKGSEQMLCFLNDLSRFSETFSTLKTAPPEPPKKSEKKEEKAQEKTPQSPTEGIADAFIQNILDSYLKNAK